MEEPVLMTRTQVDALPEYSMSFPTGTTVGKQWKANCNVQHPELSPDWYLCTYERDNDPMKVRIRWQPIKITDELAPVEWARALG